MPEDEPSPFLKEADFAVDSEKLVDDTALAHQPRSDLGNARRLMARHGDDLRALGDQRPTWIHWDGRRWELDRGRAAALLRCHATADAIDLEVAALEAVAPSGRMSKARREAIQAEIAAHRKWRVASGNKGRWAGMLEAGAAMLQISAGELDSDPFLLNLANGTIDLREDISLDGGYRLQLPQRSHLITRLAAASYDAKADGLTFRRFLDQILPDPETQLFLQRWFGYCLSGDMREQKMLIAQGVGANGKSTIFDLILKVLGDYGVSVDIKSLLHSEFKRGADASPDLARLFGRRVVLASEPEASDRLAESLVKAITGGDRIVARPLYHDPFEFFPTFKINILTNVLPTIRGTDMGIWRRIILLRFTQVIPESQRQSKTELIDAMMREASGILNWLLDGWSEYREKGLAIPPAVQFETERYRAESNPVGMFVQAATIEETTARSPATRLYGAYENWCRANAIEPRSQKWFGDRMSDLGIKREQIGVTYYCGIRLVREEFGEVAGTSDEEGLE